MSFLDKIVGRGEWYNSRKALTLLGDPFAVSRLESRESNDEKEYKSWNNTPLYDIFLHNINAWNFESGALNKIL